MRPRSARKVPEILPNPVFNIESSKVVKISLVLREYKSHPGAFNVDKKVSFLSQMGTLFSTPPKTPFSGGRAASDQELKRSEQEPFKSPTTTRSCKCDGRSYAEVVAAGPETSSMSALQESSPAWKFVAAPTDEEMPLQERLPD